MPAPLDAAAAALATNVAATPDDDAFYPCSDGRPMSDNMWQAEAMFNASGDLKTVRPDALVATDILVYPQRGNRDERIAPDVLVAFELGTHKRSSYLVWKEGKPPDWVLEVASPGTAFRDLDEKQHDYAEMGVPEYWLFDPQGDIFRRRGEPQLQGLKLVGTEYQPLDSVREHGRVVIRSEVLCLDLRVEGELIRFRDVATGEDVLHRDETEAARVREAAQLRAAQARAERAESRVQQVEAQVEREAADRQAAQERVAELEAALLRLRKGSGGGQL